MGDLPGRLAIGEAVLLPLTDEAHGEVRRVRLTPRLTPHVRHLAKYVDIAVPDGRAFVFWCAGGSVEVPAKLAEAVRSRYEFMDPVPRLAHVAGDR